MHEYFQVGIIVGAQGLKGEVRVYPTTDDPERFKELDSVYLSDEKISSCRFGSDKMISIKITAARRHKNIVLLKLEGIDDRDQALKLKNKLLVIGSKDARKLNDDQYFLDDILDCVVIDEKKGDVGHVIDIITTGSNDVYIVISKKYGSFMLPAIQDVIKKVDIEHKRIDVHLMKGLLDDQV